MGYRERKKQITQLLAQDDLAAALDALCRIPGRQAVNPLFALFFSGDDRLRWRAITAMGVVVGRLADQHMESARVVMRRLMWNLNDESGGIGWGSPEAMGEITAGHAALAAEFSHILISYIDPRGNYLEHERLQRGSLWGVGRLAHARPPLARPAAAHLPPFFTSPDPTLRGIAVWAVGPILNDTLRPQVEARLNDDAPLQLYRQMRLATTTVAAEAAAALAHPRT